MRWVRARPPRHVPPIPVPTADKLAATVPSAATGGNRLRLQTSLGNVLFWAKGYQAPETSAALPRTRELANQAEDASERFSACYGLWSGIAPAANPSQIDCLRRANHLLGVVRLSPESRMGRGTTLGSRLVCPLNQAQIGVGFL